MTGGAIVVATLVDAVLGEPPVAHPVRGMGRVLLAGKRWNAATPLGRTGRMVAGASLVAAGGAASWWVGQRSAPGPKPWIAGLSLSSVISLRELLAAGRRVRRSLVRGDLAGARASLARDLVSRDTARLTEAEIVAATVQSLAENLNDAFVAPLFHAVLGGVGAAWMYRFVNTADAVLGYRTPELEAFGKPAARADDVLGWIPARLSALSVFLAAPLAGARAAGAAAAVRTSAGATPSPNGGWPMAAVAGALDLRLEKRNVYVLHPSGAEPRASDLARAERLVALAAVVAVGLLVGAHQAWEKRA